MIELDGSYGEGGGAIIRTALALSAITGKAFKVNNIRKGRAQPGLKNQHLYAIKALKEICSAKMDGVELGSEEILFVPFKVKGGNYDINVETAGSLALVLQAIMPCLLFTQKNSKITLTGGTCGLWAPAMEYFQYVFLPHMRKYADIDFSLVKRGYFPKGNGKVEIKIKPKFTNFEELAKIDLINQGNLIQIKGISHASIDLQNVEVAERQAKTVELILKHKYKCPVNIDCFYSETSSTGSGITLYAIFSNDKGEIDFMNHVRLGSDSVGEKGKKAEKVGEEAAQSLIDEIESKAAVDKFLADQLLLFMALAKDSKIKTSKITNHTKTNIYVIEKFLGKVFEVDEEGKVISVV